MAAFPWSGPSVVGCNSTVLRGDFRGSLAPSGPRQRQLAYYLYADNVGMHGAVSSRARAAEGITSGFHFIAQRHHRR